MPFTKSSTFRLSVAVAAVLSSYAVAQTSHASWDCKANTQGEWECASGVVPAANTTNNAQSTVRSISQPTTERRLSVSEVKPDKAPSDSKPLNTASQVPQVRQAPQTPETPAPLQTTTAEQAVSTPDARLNSVTPSERPTNTEAGVSTLPDFLASDAPYAHLDWYPYTDNETRLCSGRYIEPEELMAAIAENRPLSELPIYAGASSSSADLQSGFTRLTGGVNIRQGGREFNSDYGELNQADRTASLQGKVQFRQPGLLMIAERADIDFDEGVSGFSKSQYVMHQEHLRGSAEQITHYLDDRITLEKGMVTYCEPGNNDWAIHSGSIELYPEEGYGVARHATLQVAGIPVIYMPWFRFPIDDRRQSGFLYPSLSISKGDGTDISVPYYLNLAPNLDDTLTLRFIENRGLLLENELRYLNSWSNNELSAAVLANDNRANNENRWLLGVKHQGQITPEVTSSVDFSRVSDDDYFADLGTSLEVERKEHLDQKAEIRYQADTWQLLGRFHDYQTINDNIASPYKRVPQVLLTGQEALNQRLDFNYTAEYVRFRRDRRDFFDQAMFSAPEDALRKTTADRVHLRPSLSYKYYRPWGYVHPKLSLWHSQYSFNFESAPNFNLPTSTTAGIASLDSGLYFDRDIHFRNTSYSQSFEPRLMLLHVEKNKSQPSPSQFRYFDSSALDFSYYNLFDPYGWSGNDRVSATQQATLGVSSAIYSDKGVEQLRVAVAQSHYLKDRDSMDLRPGDISGQETSSNLAFMAQWNITPTLRLSHDSEIDRNDYSFEEHNYRAIWIPNNENMLYLSYRDRVNSNNANEPIRQSDVAFRHQINPKWGVVGRWQHDIENSKKLDTLLGVEYGTCCWKMRLTGREWLTSSNVRGATASYDRGVFVEFVLRGLGSFGGDGGRGLIEEITGFKEKDHDNF